MVRVEIQDERIVRDRPALRIVDVHRLPAKQETDGARVTCVPFLVAHFLPRWTKPHDVFYSQASNWSSLEEFGPAKDRVFLAESDQLYNEADQPLFDFAALPGEPAELVILAINVVVTLLTPREFVPAREHGNALRKKKRCQKVPDLSSAQGVDFFILGWTFDSAVPRVVIGVPVPIPFPIGLVVFFIVGNEVA